MNPGNEFSESDAEGVVNRAVDACAHDFVIVFKARPVGVLGFDEVDAQTGFHGHFDGGARDFAVTHGRVAVTEIEQTASDVDRKIERVSGRDFGSVHVAAKFRRNDRAAGFAIGGSDSDTAKKRVEREFYFEVGVERLERGGVVGVVDGIEPDFFGKWRVKHGSVVGFVDGAETGRESAKTLIAVDLQVKNVNGERVARFGGVNEEWAGERVVPFGEGEGIAGFLDGVAEAVEGVGFENVAGFEMGYRCGRAVDVFYVVDGGAVLNDFGFRGGCGLRG